MTSIAGEASAAAYIPFERVYVDGKVTVAQPGDRFIYDQKSGTLQIYRTAGDISFQVPDQSEHVKRCFVGHEWNAAMTEASAELYARLGGLRGLVTRIEGSFPTLITYELVA